MLPRHGPVVQHCTAMPDKQTRLTGHTANAIEYFYHCSLTGEMGMCQWVCANEQQLYSSKMYVFWTDCGAPCPCAAQQGTLLRSSAV